MEEGSVGLRWGGRTSNSSAAVGGASLVTWSIIEDRVFGSLFADVDASPA